MGTGVEFRVGVGAGQAQHTELNKDLACVIWMAGEVEKPLVADRGFVVFVCRPEAVLLDVADRFHEEPDCPEDYACNVGSLTKRRLDVASDGRGVEQRDRQADGPDPQHLEHPEAEEREELVSLVVEAVVLAGLNDAEEEKAGEPSGP